MDTSEKKMEHKSLFNKVIDTISGIFIPVLNVLMAAALLKGILMLITNAGLLSETEGAYRILYAMSNGFFYFLPIFLAYTASNKLKADPFTSVMIAAALVYPDITQAFNSGVHMNFFGLPVNSVNYPSSVIPIILAVGLLHYVELPLDRYLPQAIKGFLKPMISALIVIPVTFLVFGPIGSLIGDGLASAYAFLYGWSPIAAGAIFGLIWQPMVVFGVQWGMVPVIISNINQFGVDTILPLLGAAVMGQAG
ncbi:MAG TPA: PTS transporter subunit EIIC, partial [Mobilitalea sp.]|nr:PTS transporter subunit EIIC [Mobilitalea sp.]